MMVLDQIATTLSYLSPQGRGEKKPLQPEFIMR
jgi:hypothetical protein